MPFSRSDRPDGVLQSARNAKFLFNQSSKGNVLPLQKLARPRNRENDPTLRVDNTRMPYADTSDGALRDNRLLHRLTNRTHSLFQDAFSALEELGFQNFLVDNATVDIRDHNAKEISPEIDAYEMRQIIPNCK